VADIPFADLPFRLKVLVRLTEELQSIARTTVDAEPCYTYDLAADVDWPLGKVFRGRGAFGRNDPLPMLSILEDPKQLTEDEALPHTSAATQSEYNLIIQGFIQDDSVHPTDPAHFLMADVKARLHALRAVRYDILGFGAKKPCVTDIMVGSGIIRPPDIDISEKAWFALPVRLCLVEDGSNAFT
jgi:hypothetical protein